MPDDQRPMVERKPAEATFQAVAVVDRSGGHDRHVKWAIAAAALVVVTALGTKLLGYGGDSVGLGPTVTSSPSLPPSPSITSSPAPVDRAIDPGRYAITLPQVRVSLTMPAGWSSAEAGTAVWKPAPRFQYTDFGRPTLAVQAVSGVAADICRVGPVHGKFVAIGPAFEDLLTALADMAGLQVSGPIDAMLGDYPARRVDLAFAPRFDEMCGGPEGRRLWQDGDGSPFGLLQGGTATVHAVEVGGQTIVIATVHRGASAEDLAQLDAMTTSIRIEPAFFPTGERGNPVIVDGVPLSFSLVGLTGANGWTPGPLEKTPDGGFWNGSLLISKSTGNGQGAEAVIYWTGFPYGRYADLCSSVLGPWVGASVREVATAIADAPGTDLVSGPSDATVGGRPAAHVVLTVRDDLGCDPGYFFSWPGECWGPCWMTTNVGTTIRVWIVEVDGKRLFIAGETHADGTELGGEIQVIVDSIQFELFGS